MKNPENYVERNPLNSRSNIHFSHVNNTYIVIYSKHRVFHPLCKCFVTFPYNSRTVFTCTSTSEDTIFVGNIWTCLINVQVELNSRCFYVVQQKCRFDRLIKRQIIPNETTRSWNLLFLFPVVYLLLVIILEIFAKTLLEIH